MQVERVALIPSAFHPSLGGVEELTGRLAQALSEAGVRPMICTNRWPRDLPECETWQGIPLHRLAFRLPMGDWKSRVTFELTRERTVGRLVSLLRSFEAQLVHVQCVSTNAWYAFEAASKLGLPVVVTLQGERTMDACGVYGMFPFFNRILLGALRNAAFVTACSGAVLEDARAYSGIPLRTRGAVVFNGVGGECFQAGPVWEHPRPYCLAYGRLAPQKGFDVLLRAFSESGLQGVDLILAGEGPQERELRGLVDTLGLQPRVRFHGRAQRPVVAALLRGALGVVVPSLREPMGIVTLEAMAAGRPLLASAVDGIPEVAAEGPDVRHVPPGDVSALAEGLRWLAAKPRHFESLENRTQAKAFLWPRIAARYRSIYEGVVRSESEGVIGADQPGLRSGCAIV